MTKTELIELLKGANVPVNEVIPEDSTVEESTRICFWEYVWEPLTASGKEYNTKVTYQVSVISEKPRCEAILYLKHKMNELDLHPTIEHEKDIESRRWHSYFSLEVLENV